MNPAMQEAYRTIGTPRFGGVLIVADHASNRIPDDIALGIDPLLLNQHIASDLGVAAVAEAMVGARQGFAAFLGNVSRLVCDCNRDEAEPGAVPIASDGHAIPGNDLTHDLREQRIARFHAPYHAALGRLLQDTPPALILSLHSFTPQLAARPEEARPWQIGVLYNYDDRAARIAIPLLEAQGLCVGDQQPYSGQLLNYTMNRHAEEDGRPYLGVEIRQDQISSPDGIARFAQILAEISSRLALQLS